MSGGRYILAEALREAKLFFRYRMVYVTGSVAFVLFILSFILGIAWYIIGFKFDAVTSKALMWGFATFIIFADVIWIAPRVVVAMQEKILEYVIAARGTIVYHVVGSTFRAMIEISLDLPLILLVFYAVFKVGFELADPILFAVAMALLLLSSIAIAGITAVLTISSRNPWIAPNIAQWIIPLSGGMIPPVLLPKNVVELMKFSPFYYLLSPVVYSAIGTWVHPPSYVLPIALLELVSLWALMLWLERRALGVSRRRGTFEVW